MWKLFLDLLFRYVMYKIIKFLSINLFARNKRDSKAKNNKKIK